MRPDPHDPPNHTAGAVLRGSHRRHREGGRSVGADSTALGMLAAPDRQMARPPGGGDPGALDVGPDTSESAPSCAGGRHGEDPGEPPKQCPCGAAVVWQGVRRAGARRAAVSGVGEVAGPHRGPRSTGSALRADALLLGAQHQPGLDRRHHPGCLPALPRRDYVAGVQQHGPALGGADVEHLRWCHRRLAGAAPRRAAGQVQGRPGVGGLPGGAAQGYRDLPRRAQKVASQFERQGASGPASRRRSAPAAPNSWRWRAWRCGLACRSTA